MVYAPNNNLTYAPQETVVQNNFYGPVGAGDGSGGSQALQAAYTQGCEDMQNQMLEKENQDLKAQLASQQQQKSSNKQMLEGIGSTAILGIPL